MSKLVPIIQTTSDLMETDDKKGAGGSIAMPSRIASVALILA
jgi:hypothetical protein